MVTEQNIKSIYGRVRKFFYNRNSTGFVNWHNLDCGWKNIKQYQDEDFGGEFEKDIIPAPQKIEFEDKMGEPFIRINFSAGEGSLIQIGDVISFRSNKLITKCKWILHDGYNYIYTVFQVTGISDDYKEQYFQQKKFVNDMYESSCQYDYEY